MNFDKPKCPTTSEGRKNLVVDVELEIMGTISFVYQAFIISSIAGVEEEFKSRLGQTRTENYLLNSLPKNRYIKMNVSQKM